MAPRAANFTGATLGRTVGGLAEVDAAPGINGVLRLYGDFGRPKDFPDWEDEFLVSGDRV